MNTGHDYLASNQDRSGDREPSLCGSKKSNNFIMVRCAKALDKRACLAQGQESAAHFLHELFLKTKRSSSQPENQATFGGETRTGGGVNLPGGPVVATFVWGKLRTRNTTYDLSLMAEPAGSSCNAVATTHRYKSYRSCGISGPCAMGNAGTGRYILYILFFLVNGKLHSTSGFSANVMCMWARVCV